MSFPYDIHSRIGDRHSVTILVSNRLNIYQLFKVKFDCFIHFAIQITKNFKDGIAAFHNVKS